ncbi:MAG: phage tail protein [Brevundimonas sp.]|uniref:gpW family head-tail joining protein n=1 Tax=Brevundimonas sp. TaxID=1871086 RepID=UPI0025BBD9E3|nr:gpW family head-tail joining protein [Brevundimonas sp.]MBX3476677.1 phage tail protein [Brevundimonas sp.]
MATLAEQIAEAEAAYHALQTGKAVVEVQDSNGERVRYSQANAGRLAAYIAELKRRIAGAARPTTILFRTSKGI